MRKLVFLTVIWYVLPSGNSIAGSGTVEITEWKVSGKNTRSRDPSVDRQGRVRLIGQKERNTKYGSVPIQIRSAEPGFHDEPEIQDISVTDLAY